MRTWGELLGDDQPEPDPEAETAGFLGRLGGSLGRTSRAIRQRLTGFDPLDDESWEALEESLIGADVGMTATVELVERLRMRGAFDDLAAALAEEIEALLGEPGTLSVNDGPSVLLVVGVNGTGKTTTIGKLAHRLAEHGARVSSRLPTRFARRRRSSSRSGRSARASTTSAHHAAATRPRSPSTRSRRRRRAAATS